MARFTHSVGGETYRFDSLKDVMAKASPARLAISRRRRGEQRRRAGRRADGPGRHPAQTLPRRGADSLRGRRGHPPDHRHPPARRLRPGVPSHRRRLPRLAARRRRRRGQPARPGSGPDAGNGSGGIEDHACPGSGPGGAEDPRGHPLPQHPRPSRPALHPPATEPPDRRPGRNRREHPRRPAVRQWRRDARDQSCHRQHGLDLRPAGDARRDHPALRDSYPGLRADPRHQLHRGDQPRRAAGPGVPVDRRHRGGQCQLRHQPEDPPGRLRGRAQPEARHPRQQPDVLRDRPGQRARPTPTTASTSRPARPAPMRWLVTSSRSW